MLPRFPYPALIALGLVLTAPAAYAAEESVPNRLEVTDQKSAITILQPSAHPLYDLFTKRFVELGRFDYFPISYRNDTKLASVNELRAKFQEYLKNNAAAIASKGQKPDFKFGDVVLTGDKLDKLLKSAYVMVPRWTYSPIQLSEVKSVTDKDGVETLTVEAKSDLTLVNEVINVQTGEVIGTESATQKVSKQIENRIPPNITSAKRNAQDELFKQEIKAARTMDPMLFYKDEAIVPSSIAMTAVLSDVRKLDAFVLKSKFAGEDGALKMLLGSDMGVIHDSTFNVYRRENGEVVNVGFVKVREIGEKDSVFQGIQDRGFEPDDQLIEHPRTGYDGGVKLGMVTFDPTGGSALAPALMLTGETDLAPIFKTSALSETYATVDTNFMLPLPLDTSKMLVGAEGLVGLKKRFYLNQFVLSAGLKGGLAASSGTVAQTVITEQNNAGNPISPGSNIDVIGVGLGAGPALGVEYQANPDLKIGLDAGFLFFTKVTPYKVSVTDRVSKDVSEFDVSQLRDNLIPNPISATGLTFALTGTYSF